MTKGKLDTALSPRAVTWLSELECIDALEEEAERQVVKARKMEMWLNDKFTKSLWLDDFSLRFQKNSAIVNDFSVRIQKNSAIVRNYWLGEEFRIHCRGMKPPWKLGWSKN